MQHARISLFYKDFASFTCKISLNISLIIGCISLHLVVPCHRILFEGTSFISFNGCGLDSSRSNDQISHCPCHLIECHHRDIDTHVARVFTCNKTTWSSCEKSRDMAFKLLIWSKLEIQDLCPWSISIFALLTLLEPSISHFFVQNSTINSLWFHSGTYSLESFHSQLVKDTPRKS